jgi:hypothetical protein
MSLCCVTVFSLGCSWDYPVQLCWLYLLFLLNWLDYWTLGQWYKGVFCPRVLVLAVNLVYYELLKTGPSLTDLCTHNLQYMVDMQ